MTSQHITLAIPGFERAMLTLPEPKSIAALGRIESALWRALTHLRQDLLGDGMADPGSIEFDSWVIERSQRAADPGSVEYDSWFAPRN